MPSEVAHGVVRLGSRLVNWYLVEESDRITVVDAGLPAYWPQLPAALEARGRRLDDVAAVVLTHAHADHVGLAERIRREAGARLLVHEADAEMLRTGKQPRGERSLFPYLRHGTAWRLLLHLTRAGGTRIERPADMETFSGGDVLDVPGSPRVIHAPGHSAGCCAFHLPAQDALFSGDVLCTRNPLTGRGGPQIMPSAFNPSDEQALASLDLIEPLDAGVLLPGHGEPWSEGPGAAVAAARAAGPG